MIQCYPFRLHRLFIEHADSMMRDQRSGSRQVCRFLSLQATDCIDAHIYIYIYYTDYIGGYTCIICTNVYIYIYQICK